MVYKYMFIFTVKIEDWYDTNIDCCCIQYNIQHSPLTTVTTATLQHRASFINSSNRRITLHTFPAMDAFGNYFYNKVGCKTSKLLRIYY